MTDLVHRNALRAYMYWASSGEYLYSGYAGEGYAQFRTSSHVRFLFECFSESTSDGIHDLYFIPTRGSFRISSRLVYIQVRLRPQIYDSVYQVAVVSCAWDRRKKRFGCRPRLGYKNGTQTRCKKFKWTKTWVSLRNYIQN